MGGLFAAMIAAPKIHGLQQLLSRYPDGDVPEIDLDDLDLLDPWVIDGRYAADLPDLTHRDAQQLLAAAARVVDPVLRNRGPGRSAIVPATKQRWRAARSVGWVTALGELPRGCNTEDIHVSVVMGQPRNQRRCR